MAFEVIHCHERATKDKSIMILKRTLMLKVGTSHSSIVQKGNRAHIYLALHLTVHPLNSCSRCY